MQTHKVNVVRIMGINANVFASGLLGVAVVAVGASLIAGITGNLELSSQFFPIIYACLIGYIVLTGIKIWSNRRR